ncbi:MAG TPA: serine/threonine-protein kinase, partial [Planctomycetia bacterium]|nr:serine/threonine-protein kinase [Planctomycetia bacterium]
MSSPADLNLLFGILCVQNGFVTTQTLIEGMNAWVLDKRRPLSDILKERGLSVTEHDAVAAMVALQLARHGDDPAASLAALPTDESATLYKFADSDVQASLATINIARGREGAATMYVAPEDRPGSRYTVLRRHAVGGLGAVFVARDEELSREVALKEIRVDRPRDPDSISRFLFEGEVTGRLEHPGIVPVYGLGTYTDGRPYYAMRFVKGESLDDAVKSFHKSPDYGSLEFRGLLRRFLDVCNAIAYAHSRGVLHRDLKPANVMLGEFGETLVVDWGLAKVVGREEPDGGEATLAPSSGSELDETQQGSAIGTPAFMAPEQAEGRIRELGPAADVYALGGTLFAVLSGEPPIEGKKIEDILGNVRSGRLRPLPPAVPRPLAAICLKALALRTADRYDSVRSLAADVENWLADEPVSATRDAPLARASRWVRKHPAPAAGGFAFAAMLLLGLTVGLIAAERYNHRLRLAKNAVDSANTRLAEQNEALDASRREAREALDAAVDESVGDLLAAKATLSGRERNYLQSALKRYESFAKARGDDEEAQVFQSQGLFRVGRIQEKLGMLAEAARSFQDAIALLDRRNAAGAGSLERRAALAEGLADAGSVFQ